LILLYKHATHYQHPSYHHLTSAQLTCRNNNPECIHEHKIKPEVIRLWSVIGFPREEFVEETGAVVEDVAIELACGDERLDWVAEGRVGVARDALRKYDGETKLTMEDAARNPAWV